MNFSLRLVTTLLVGYLALSAGTPGRAEDPVRMREDFPAGYLYHVSTRVDLSGDLVLPLEKGQTQPRKLAVTGDSAIEYDERVLAADRDDRVQKTARLFPAQWDPKLGIHVT